MTDAQTKNVSKFADDNKIAERKRICSECEHSTVLGLCSKCGCIISIKTRMSKQSCPINKWNAVNNQ